MILPSLIGGFLLGFGVALLIDENDAGIVYIVVGAALMVVFIAFG